MKKISALSRLSLTGLILMTSLGAWASGSVSDSQLAVKHAASDRALLQIHAVKNAAITSELARTTRSVPHLNLGFLSAKATDDGCVDQCVSDCQGGAGSAACWQQCTNEGYESDTCAPRCGVATSAGSQACWTKCNMEDYSSDICAPRCGTTTASGSLACWNRCDMESYSSDICAPRCGVSTPEGSQACWNQCSTEGYSSDICAPRCGHN